MTIDKKNKKMLREWRRKAPLQVFEYYLLSTLELFVCLFLLLIYYKQQKSIYS